jgi:hypothetical protein
MPGFSSQPLFERQRAMTKIDAVKYSISLAAAGFIAFSVFAAKPASAGDMQADVYSCEELWVIRNQIYKDRGFCFKSAKAISHFGNAGCQYDNISLVPLSDMDRVTIKEAKKSQNRLGC